MKIDKIKFVGLTDYNKPYTRVRCYNFSTELNKLGFNTGVFSYQKDLIPDRSGVEMLNLPELERIKLNFRAYKQLYNSGADCIYLQKIHYHAAAPYLLNRFKKIKLILDYDDYDFDRSPMFKTNLLNSLIFGSSDIKKITENIAERSEKCIVSSHKLLNILKIFNRQTFLIPTGVDCKKFIPVPGKKNNNTTTFVWNGMIWGQLIYDNVKFMFDCIREISKKGIPCRLFLAGDGYYFNKLKTSAETEYKDIEIKIFGYIPPDNMPDFLNKCDIGLLPLVPDKQNYDWMESKSPTKLFEYMAAGICPVSSDFGEAPFIIKNGETGFLAQDKEDFVKKILLLVENKELYNKISNNVIKETHKKYSLEVLGKKLAGILASI